MAQLVGMELQHQHFEHDVLKNDPLEQLLTLLQQLEQKKILKKELLKKRLSLDLDTLFMLQEIQEM
jgi:hypothetical protein